MASLSSPLPSKTISFLCSFSEKTIVVVFNLLLLSIVVFISFNSILSIKTPFGAIITNDLILFKYIKLFYKIFCVFCNKKQYIICRKFMFVLVLGWLDMFDRFALVRILSLDGDIDKLNYQRMKLFSP